MPLTNSTLLLGAANKARSTDVALLDPTVILDVVRSRKYDINVRDAIVNITIERTMSGASTVTFELYDPDRRILRSPALRYAIQIELDNWGYRLFSINKTGDILTLVFEDKAVAYLRQKKGILVSASRNKLTRVQFCMHLISRVKSADIKVIAPEAQKKQRIKKLNNADTGQLVESRESGINENGDFTIKGAKANKSQIRNIETVLRVGAEEGARNKVLIAAAMTVIGESLAKNEQPKFATKIGIDGQPVQIPLDAGSWGVFRQRPSMGWPPYGSSVEEQAKAFYTGSGDNIGAIEVDKENPEFMAWEICAAVQRPRTDLRQSTYEPWKQEAIAFVDEFSPGSAGSDRSFRGRYIFSTRDDNGKIENFWDCIKRLMDEVQWAAFAQQGAIYLMREAYLSSSKAIMTISPESHGVEDIDIDWNVNKKDAKATVKCYAHRWDAPAGSRVTLRDMGEGPSDAAWLVDSITRTYDDPLCTIELRTAQHSLPEPAPEIITVALGDQGPDISGSDASGLPDAIAAMYRKAQDIDGKGYPYSWGGGHPKAGVPSRGTSSSTGGPVVLGYDCSGFIGALLAAAKPHLSGERAAKLPTQNQDSVPASGSFGAYGVPGEGKYFTWYYNSGHIFGEFKRPKNTEEGDDGEQVRKPEHVGTGRWGTSSSGAGFKPELHPHTGFQAAHIQGM